MKNIIVITFLFFSISQAIAQTERYAISNFTGKQINVEGTQFVGSDGKSVSLRQYFKDKPVVISLGYYECPDICGLVLSGMLEGFKEIDFVSGQDFEVVTISIDPRESSKLADSKRATFLKDLKKIKPAADWNFLTGTEENIMKLSGELGFSYKYQPENGQYAHPPGIFVLDRAGVIHVSLPTVMYPKEILEYALIRASDGKLGSIRQRLHTSLSDYDFHSDRLKMEIWHLIFGLAALSSVLFLSLWALLKKWRADVK